ncbi:MAG: DNA mismatch repair endonuclease MutL [Clostridia bacterium]|nr:DNA mismatch repair endonuclease MutL [Clostridia bacterium]
MAINILDSMIINRISAGEVVESPFSIVKELIDNSLDAGADKITIEIKNGGIDLISVKDNGCGIDKDDLYKAFMPHATSKITNLEDLEQIATLGFRGEALASISNVSQTSVISKTKASDCSYALDVRGGDFGQLIPTTSDNGTTFTISNLFFNTPARRKFLRKPKQEENQITNIIARYILAHPSVNFKYIVDGKTIYQSHGKTLSDAIYCVYGSEFTQNLLPIEKSLGNIKLTGFVSKIGFSKPNTTYQTLMINSRYVVDDIVSKATYMAMEEYLMPRQFPVYIFNLDMPTIDVDVNVHPSKMNVKFSNPSKIYDLVYSAIKSAIYKFINPVDTAVDASSSQTETSLIKTDLSSLNEISILPNSFTNAFDTNISLKQDSFTPITMFDKDVSQSQTPNNEPKVDMPQEQTEKQVYQNISDLSDYKIVGELFNEFIILERGDNMLLLDFHAGHERLNYDKFVKMVHDREIVVQDLLVPYVHNLSVQEIEYVMQLKPTLCDMGFDVDEFGDKGIIINSVPMQLKDINLKNFVDDLLHDMKNIKPKMDNEITHFLMQKACKSSVKSGMKLSEYEIKELLKNLDINHPVLLCPHGRPILTVIKRSQIEKWFKRIV